MGGSAFGIGVMCFAQFVFIVMLVIIITEANIIDRLDSLVNIMGLTCRLGGIWCKCASCGGGCCTSSCHAVCICSGRCKLVCEHCMRGITLSTKRLIVIALIVHSRSGGLNVLAVNDASCGWLWDGFGL